MSLWYRRRGKVYAVSFEGLQFLIALALLAALVAGLVVLGALDR